jgi:hypothetical protein
MYLAGVCVDRATVEKQAVTWRHQGRVGTNRPAPCLRVQSSDIYIYRNHRLNMELDLQSLNGLRNPPPPPHLVAVGQPRQTASLSDPLTVIHERALRIQLCKDMQVISHITYEK